MHIYGNEFLKDKHRTGNLSGIVLYSILPKLWREAGSNTSTMRVVGDDEIWSLESETVKYGCEFQGIQTQERLRWRGPAEEINDRSILSSEWASDISKPPTVWQ
jgi:hypothetical protein